jgi:hypothetical protein
MLTEVRWLKYTYQLELCMAAQEHSDNDKRTVGCSASEQVFSAQPGEVLERPTDPVQSLQRHSAGCSAVEQHELA